MRFFKSAALAALMLLFTGGAVFAQGTAPAAPAAPSLVLDLKPIGAGLIIIGAALGIGGLGRAAVESMARQPELAGNIQTAMIIAAALIEGVTFFALLLQIIV
jgi:F-type H+-transporting ATPase subunit c